MSERDGFERDVRTVSGLTFASRIAGLARDAALARVFGAGAVADAFLFAFMVPNLLRRLFGEGALSAAFLPVFSRLRDRSGHAASRLGRRVVVAMTGVLTAFVLLAEIGILLAGPEGSGQLAARLTMILLPYAPLVCIVAVTGAMLQVRGRFGPPAAAPLLLNVAMIAALLGPAKAWTDQPGRHAAFVALSVVVAGLVQVAWMFILLRQPDAGARDDRSETAEPVTDAEVSAAGRDVLRHAIPMIIGLGVLQIGTLIDGFIASWPTVVGPTVLGYEYPLDQGAMTRVTLAQRLYQFPLGVFGIAIATAIFPVLARRAAAGDRDGLRASVRSGLRLSAFIAFPATVGLIVVREPLVATMFQGGAFEAADVVGSARVLAGYAAGVWAYSMVHLLTRAFYALEEPSTPVRVAVATLGLNLALNLYLIWTPLREAGLATSTAITASLQVVVLARLLGRRTGSILDVRTAASLIASLVMAIVMGVALVVVDRFLPDAWPAGARLAVLVAAGIALYGTMAVIRRTPELDRLLGRRPAEDTR